MKFILTFLVTAIISFSFVGKNSDILNGNLHGIWQGANGDNSMI